MDEKLNAALMGIWESLTDEQKEKAKQCRTMEELTLLAGREGVELPDELLTAVAGGIPLVGDTNPYCPYCKDYSGIDLNKTEIIVPEGESGRLKVDVFRCAKKNRTYYFSEERKKYYDDTCHQMKESSGGLC